MASTYSTSLRLELMATGDQSGTWGDTTNTNLGTLLEQSITGYLSKAMADTNQTLTNLNGASDEARNMIVEATGALTAGRDMIVPTAEKLYLIKNSTTGGFAVTVKTSAGTGVAVPMNGSRWVYCDGTNVVDGMSGPLTPTTNSSAALGSSTLGWSALFIDSSSAGTLATLSSTDAGATAGPVIDLYRNSASPATNDILGKVLFNGEDSAGNTQEYASIEAVIADPTSTSEDGALDFYTTVAGTRALRTSIGGGVYLAGATGGDKGVGTVNATALYKNNVEVNGAVALASVATTSGSTVNVTTAIPSWATQVTVNLNQVSENAGSVVRIQLGDSGGFITTGYLAVSSQISSGGTAITEYTDGFNMRLFSAATASVSGSVTFTKQGSTDVWCAQGVLYDSDGTGVQGFVSGILIMSNPLTQIRLSTSGTFDAGSVNARYS